MTEGSTTHPHDSYRPIPERVEPETLRECSTLEPRTALFAVLEEWALIAAAILVCVFMGGWPVYLLSILFLGARQHALAILGHDASHFRFLPGHKQNDLFGNLLLMWPVFASVEGFRRFHGSHHQHTNLESDGNRQLWKTHTPEGQLAPQWRYPKTAPALFWTLLKRAAFFTGAFWIFRGLFGPLLLRLPGLGLRLLFYGAAIALLTLLGAWWGFFLYWIVPYCTWHIMIQYIRLICEHSAVHSDRQEYQITRTTIPTLLESIFILPRNVGYHLEHHWYPGVPFYHLPRLHQYLMAREGFSLHANIKRSLFNSLRECIRV